MFLSSASPTLPRNPIPQSSASKAIPPSPSPKLPRICRAGWVSARPRDLEEPLREGCWWVDGLGSKDSSLGLLRHLSLVWSQRVLLNIVIVVQSLSRVRLFVTPWTVAHQAPLSIAFSRQKHWSGLLCPSPGDLPDPGIKPGSSAWQADSLQSEPPGKSLLSELKNACTSQSILARTLDQWFLLSFFGSRGSFENLKKTLISFWKMHTILKLDSASYWTLWGTRE